MKIHFAIQLDIINELSPTFSQLIVCKVLLYNFKIIPSTINTV